MSNFLRLFDNFILFSALISWLVAQLLKTIIDAIKFKTLNFERLVGSGGMPSSHTSTVIALAVSVAMVEGMDSPVFAVSMILACVVMYDATGVRRAAGEQAKVLNRLVSELHKKNNHINAEKVLKEFLGHTPLEVFGGAIIGIAVPILLSFVW